MIDDRVNLMGLKSLKQLGELHYSINKALPNGTLRFNHLYSPDRFLIVEVVKPRFHSDNQVYNVLYDARNKKG